MFRVVKKMQQWVSKCGQVERTRDLFKKIRDTKGTFHGKMGTIKDRNDRDLTEANGEGIGTHSSTLAW